MKWIAALFPSKEKPVPSSSTKICCKESIVIVYFIRSLTAYKGWFSSLSLFPLWAVFWNLSFLWGFGTFLKKGCSCKAGLFFFERLAFLPLWKGRSFSFPSLVPIMGESSAPVWK